MKSSKLYIIWSTRRFNAIYQKLRCFDPCSGIQNLFTYAHLYVLLMPVSIALLWNCYFWNQNSMLIIYWRLWFSDELFIIQSIRRFLSRLGKNRYRRQQNSNLKWFNEKLEIRDEVGCEKKIMNRIKIQSKPTYLA